MYCLPCLRCDEPSCSPLVHIIVILLKQGYWINVGYIIYNILLDELCQIGYQVNVGYVIYFGASGIIRV